MTTNATPPATSTESGADARRAETAELDSLPTSPAKPRGKEFGLALLLVVVMVAVLVWLYRNADAVSYRDHQAYTLKLHQLQETDLQTYTHVLASRFNLDKNYDAITSGIRIMNNILQHLKNKPSFLSKEDASRLDAQLANQALEINKKTAIFEVFIRESAVMRNSSRYFPMAVKEFIKVDSNPALQTQVTLLSNDLMTYLFRGDAELAGSLQKNIETLHKALHGLDSETAQKLKNLLDHAEIILNAKLDVDHRLEEVSDIRSEASGQRLTQIYTEGYAHAAKRSQTYRVLLLVVALALAVYLVLIFVRLEGTTRALTDSNLKLIRHIAELGQTQSNLKLYATVFENAAEGMVITDGQARIIVVNPAFTTITGYSLDEIKKQPPSLLSSEHHPATFYHDMWKALERRGKWQGEIWNHHKEGRLFSEWLSITAVKNPMNVVTNYIGVFSDTTERRKIQDDMQHLSYHDALTDLPNRLLMQERLNEAITQSRRIACHTAVLFLNLDRFRNINDTLGSELGDALLKEVANRCRKQLRDTDTVARLGGDEFIFVLPDINQPQDVVGITRTLLNNIGRPYQLGEHTITITASIGVAISDTDGTTAAELLRNADTAMSRAKEEGRNNFRFYSADMNTATLGDLLLENQLRSAVEHNELEIFYQPKVDAKTGILESAEALLRWRHPEQGLLQPDRFIRLAEESGLIVAISEWVLRATCRQMYDWRASGLPIVPIAVNLSAQQFLQDGLPELVQKSLAESRLDAVMLELELTESMLMKKVDRTITILKHLREMGVSLSIDDFGTGYSSLSYLNQFEVNVLKIDRSFVSDITHIDDDGKIAVAIIGLAHALGLKVVAEGVETDEQRLFLLKHGCDIFQGYYFSRPIPAAEFARKLEELKQVTLSPA